MLDQITSHAMKVGILHTKSEVSWESSIYQYTYNVYSVSIQIE